MKRKIIAVVCLLLTAAIIGLILQGKKQERSSSIPLEQNFSTDFAYDNQLFLSGVAYAHSKIDPNLPPFKTLIVPHHLVASGIISQGLDQLSNKTHPDTIIILSPNHTDVGTCPVISSLKSWDTPYGTVDSDIGVTLSLLSSGTICLDDKNISQEHGIAGLLPFIKYYLPNTKIVSLAFKKNITYPVLEQISQKISQLSNTVILSSIDFSHGLPPEKSKIKDEQTLSLIEKNDYLAITNLDSTHLDSPPVLIVSLLINKSWKLDRNLSVHSDASTITGKDNADNTSYYLLGYSKPSTEKWTLTITGDVMLGRSVNTQSLKNKDFTWAFKEIAPVLKKSDLTLINLESPLIKDCPPTDKGMIFCGSSNNLQGLTFSGVDLANIANNHIFNHGTKGAEETISNLESAKIDAVGLGKTPVKRVGGTEVAFAGFDATTKQPDKEVKQIITDLKKKYPLVVVSFHWGQEYQRQPNKKQIDLAHLAIDSGADVIVGTHPHWVQTEETYRGKPIFYSLGNLIFDQMWSEQTKKGMVVTLTFSGSKLQKTDHYPVDIYDYGQARLAASSKTP